MRAIPERAAALPLAVLVTTRPVADGTEVGRTLDALGAPVVTVAPLADDEVSILATGVLGHPPDPVLRAALDEARGNPLLVLTVRERGDGPHSGTGPAALTRRLAELDAAALRTLQLAAHVAGDAVLCFLDLYGNRVADAVRRASDIVERAELPRAADAHVFQPWFIACLVHLETDRLDLLTTAVRRGREVAV